MLQPEPISYDPDAELPGAAGVATALRQALEVRRGQGIPPGHIARIEIELSPESTTFSARSLEAAAIYPRIYWRSRTTGRKVAAIGCVQTGQLDQMLPCLQSADPGATLFGGASFDPAPSLLPDWQDFPSSQFFIPQAEWIAEGSRVRLAVNFTREDTDFTSVVNWLRDAARPLEDVVPCALARWDSPNFLHWSMAVNAALEAMRSGSMEKAVLARRSSFELAEPVPAFALLELLADAAPNCFHFCFEPTPISGAFLGISPELLYRRSGTNFESEAVAGTRPRSLDAAEDDRMGNQLLELEKERHEHQVVVDSLRGTLQKLCSRVYFPTQPALLRLLRVQHLRTAFAGTLKDAVSDADVLAAMHPTPATCGRPTNTAREFIQGIEPFDRGWYAGPLGIVNTEEAEFCVAIRSMHLRGNVLNVFAGAGIVEGSNAENEWSELESKIGDVLRVLSS